MKYQIIHAERDFRFHQKLKTAFSIFPDFHFIDYSCYLDATFQLLNKHQPAILITASKLFDETDVVASFCAYRDATMPELKIMVLTGKENLDHFLSSVVSRVDGYISKSCTMEEIYQCMTNIINGDSYLGIQKQAIKH